MTQRLNWSLRRCLDVSKVNYQLRCSGDRLSSELLARFDAGLRASVESTLGGTLKDESWVQATLAVPAAGLGLREATSLALPAFIASRVAARPAVMIMAGHAADAGLLTTEAFAAYYDQRTENAVVQWLAEMPQDLHAHVRDRIADASTTAAQWWNDAAAGVPRAHHVNEEGDDAAILPGGGLVAGLGTEDDEHPAPSRSLPALLLQRRPPSLLLPVGPIVNIIQY